MSGLSFGLGRFGDRRLEKGGQRCTRLWLRVRARAFGALEVRGRGRCSLRAGCATAR
jgi:hypothetical protein